MTIAAFQSSIGVCAVRERVASFLMTVGAQSSYRIGFGGLRMGVVARLALDARLAVYTRTPFVCGRFMACLTQIRVRRDRHARSRVSGLERAVASLARHTLLRVSS